MIQPIARDVYFEELTLANLLVAFALLIKGKRVYYFKSGRYLGRVPLVNLLLLNRFRRSESHLNQFPGLVFEIHQAALDVAEEIFQEISQHNQGCLNHWRKVFRSERVNLFIKKLAAIEAFKLFSSYLKLMYQAREDGNRVQIMVIDSPLNRILVPFLRRRYPGSRIELRGLSGAPCQYLHTTSSTLLSSGEYILRLALLIGKRRWNSSCVPQRFKASKEILWGIGTNRRNDDFLVDGIRISAKDILFYYASDSGVRSRPEILQQSIENASTRGYQCVNFDQAPMYVSLLRRCIIPRYLIFPGLLIWLALFRQFHHSSASLLNGFVLAFLMETVKWEIFLASYRPALNLSQDDERASHIADTVALNLHGSSNAGFQYADLTQWRAVTTAYLGYNLYFAWGALSENYWKGSWAIDQVVYIGYLWGHHYLESFDQRQETRRALMGENSQLKFVVGLFDENPSPVTYVSDKTLFDFYRIGVKLLKTRSDTLVVAKPKRLEGVPQVAEVQELIKPYVEAGRLIIWDRLTADVTHLIAISDAVVSMAMGVPYLEAVCCKTIGLNYAPSKNYSSPVYAQANGRLVFDNVESVLDKLERALDHPDENPWDGLEALIDDLDPHRDCLGMERLRSYIQRLDSPDSHQQTSGTASSPGI